MKRLEGKVALITGSSRGIGRGIALAIELAPYHINVNTVNPGWIDTPGARERGGNETIDAGGLRVPWGRMGAPKDISKAVAFLVSHDSDYVTGATLRVDGGYVLGLRLPDEQPR